MTAGETIAAIATPSGHGALAIIRISGERALDVSVKFLHLKNHQGNLPPRRMILAEAKDHASVIDEVMVAQYPAPKSATGENMVEIFCHGSPYIARRLLSAALKAGARLAEPGEFTQRAFLNGRMDLSQAEAVGALINAHSHAAHRAAISQLRGGISEAIQRLREPLLELLVRIEACLDHPEEDIPSLPPKDVLAALSGARTMVSALSGTFSRGRRAVEGSKICLIGRPNAGKSSLFNAMLGYERAIVCPEPGTTRDTIEEHFSAAGASLLLIDTAGLRDEPVNPVEKIGISRTDATLKSCDLALLVIDGSRDPDAQDDRIHRKILELAAQNGRQIISILNKTDLPQARNDVHADIRVSATTGNGLESLMRLIADKTASQENHEDETAITSLRHYQALKDSIREIENAEKAVREWPNLWEDRVAQHLRESLLRLGDIIGEGAPDEVLHEIFSRFCVGK
ncbi:MAG: tRNA uridine-5-carboxymethylaminomethyl(34) synthesis GTPase MnmE [Elusimicrobiota bacterium]